MILHPGGLIGLPAGVPSVVYDVALWRDLLVVVALAAALSEARARRGAALAFALLFAVLAVGFWVAAMNRPYGVLVDPATTRWAADLSVAGRAGGSERFLAGEPGVERAWTTLAQRTRADLVLLAPTILPLLVLPAGGIVIARVWPHREATLAAILWLGASTSALDLLRGTGFLTGLWSRPRASLLWLATLAAVLLLARSRLPRPGRAVLGALAAACWLALGRRDPALDPGDAVLALTLDHHVWLAMGAVGLWRSRDPAAIALVAGGAILTVLRAVGGPGDPWAGVAFCRVGLVLGATDWMAAAARALTGQTAAAGTAAAGRGGIVPARLPHAVAIAVVLAGGLLAWWDPPRTDPVARLSLEPYPEALVEAMTWIRTQTPPEASWLADEDYPAAIAVLGGRRVLRAPGLLSAPDDERRSRLQRATLAGRPPAALLRRYGLRYVFVAPGHFRAEGIDAPEDLEGRGSFRMVYANEKGMRVFEIGPSEPPGGASSSIK
ncbi:MAG TPA: hypothetical protein VMR21_13845 [Vicinamibacteria bacterium]|nr:hypothetical protein [Vicinamibacteria bacterium]